MKKEWSTGTTLIIALLIVILVLMPKPLYIFNKRDPTYQEMQWFLVMDRTEQEEYIDDEYVCRDFAYQLASNAQNWGYMAYVIYLYVQNGTVGHAIVMFNTPDRGRIYIEPQTDEEVNISTMVIDLLNDNFGTKTYEV